MMRADVVRLAAERREAWFVPVEVPPELRIRLDRGWVSPHYGLKTETARLVAEVIGRVPVAFGYVFADRLPTPDERAEWLGLLG